MPDSRLAPPGPCTRPVLKAWIRRKQSFNLLHGLMFWHASRMLSGAETKTSQPWQWFLRFFFNILQICAVAQTPNRSRKPEPSLIFLSLFLLEKREENKKQQGFAIPTEPLKSLEKKGKNALSLQAKQGQGSELFFQEPEVNRNHGTENPEPKPEPALSVKLY